MAPHLRLGNDLVPAVFRIAEYDRADRLEHVQLPPQASFLRHGGRGGNLRHPLRKRYERLPVLPGEFQPLRSKARNHLAVSGLVEPRGCAVAVILHRVWSLPSGAPPGGTRPGGQPKSGIVEAPHSRRSRRILSVAGRRKTPDGENAGAPRKRPAGTIAGWRSLRVQARDEFPRGRAPPLRPPRRRCRSTGVKNALARAVGRLLNGAQVGSSPRLQGRAAEIAWPRRDLEELLQVQALA